jgi:hypothetical protein
LPLPATIAFTAKPDFLAKASVRTRKIPLSCVVVVVVVVVVVRMISSLGLTGCTVTEVARPVNATKQAAASKRAKRRQQTAVINSIRAHLAELITSKFETVQAGSRCLLQLRPSLPGIPALLKVRLGLF